MPIRYDLVDANHRAVQLLHQGQYARAIHVLENALQFLRKVAVETTTTTSDSIGNASSSDPTLQEQKLEQQQQLEQRYNQYHLHDVGDIVIVASSYKCPLWNDASRCPDGVFSFCSRPMILAGRHDQVIRSSHNQNRAAATLMYNLSLAHQGLFGLPPPPIITRSSASCKPTTQSPSPFGDRILTCSLKVCSMAVDLISRIPSSITTPGDSVMYVLALNNQGFLHVYFSNRAEANHTMSMLELFFASQADDNDDDDVEYGYSGMEACDDDFDCDDYGTRVDRSASRVLSDRDAYKSAVNDVVYSVLLCQGRTVLDAAPAA